MADLVNDTKVYGVPAETGRWVFVLAGMIMNLCLGTVYAWSVFRKPLQEFFSTPEVKITATQTLLPFMLFLGACLSNRRISLGDGMRVGFCLCP